MRKNSRNVSSLSASATLTATTPAAPHPPAPSAGNACARPGQRSAVPTARIPLGVIATHHALQFWKLANHAGDQIGLAQQPRPTRLLGRMPSCAKPLRNLSRQRRDPVCPRPLRANLGVERDPSSFGSSSSSGVFKSKSQKCRASANRARNTRSLPAMIAAPPSGASRLATNAKNGAGCPAASRVAKYFWFTFIDSSRTSGGKSMNLPSIRPNKATGHSTKPAHFTEQRSSVHGTIAWRDVHSMLVCAASQLLANFLLRSAASCNRRKRASSFSCQSAAEATVKRAGRHNPVPFRHIARRHRPQHHRHHHAVQQADHPPQRPHPGKLAAAAPTHRLRPVIFCNAAGSFSRNKSTRAAPERNLAQPMIATFGDQILRASRRASSKSRPGSLRRRLAWAALLHFRRPRFSAASVAHIAMRRGPTNVYQPRSLQLSA